MKILDTNLLIDGSRGLLHELYESRLQDNYDRAMLELRTYHLPPLFSYPAAERNRTALRPEICLFDKSDTQLHHRSKCPTCDQTRPLYRGRCLECWSIDVSNLWRGFPMRLQTFSQMKNCSAYAPSHLKYLLTEPWLEPLEANTLKELLQQARLNLKGCPTVTQVEAACWSTPKKNFMVLELGCERCGYVPDFRDHPFFWASDFSEWGNGVCPECVDHDRGLQDVWNLQPRTYRAWQDEYTSVRRLMRTVERYGSLALLLVNPSPVWANYVVKACPTVDPRPKVVSSYGKKMGAVFAHRPATLDDLNLDLEEILDVS